MEVTKSISIFNTGAAKRTIRPPKMIGDKAFSVVRDFCSGKTIAPGGACSISIRFTPEKPRDNYLAKLSVGTDATDAKPLEIPLKGTFDDQASPR